MTLLDAAACLAAHGIGVDLELKKRAFIVVHAQSPRQIECCAELGRSRLTGSLPIPERQEFSAAAGGSQVRADQACVRTPTARSYRAYRAAGARHGRAGHDVGGNTVTSPRKRGEGEPAPCHIRPADLFAKNEY